MPALGLQGEAAGRRGGECTAEARESEASQPPGAPPRPGEPRRRTPAGSWSGGSPEAGAADLTTTAGAAAAAGPLPVPRCSRRGLHPGPREAPASVAMETTRGLLGPEVRTPRGVRMRVWRREASTRRAAHACSEPGCSRPESGGGGRKQEVCR